MQATTRSSKERIKVFARCRPAIDEEKKGSDDFKSCVEIKGNEIKVSRPNHQPKSFTFDGIFGPDSTQEQVFKTVSLDAIEDVFNGYHSTIFVYGQTGTGKHTLSNIDDLHPDQNGLVPRCIQEIYNRIDSDINHDYRVRMNYLQIYMETLQDLLQPDHKNLQIREDPELGIYVSGICFKDINNYDECIKSYREGDLNRITALTKMNATSSRSHSCLIINVQKSSKLNSEELDGLEKKKVTTANLFLVDLAGSERLKKTEAEGIRKKEANYINLSLTTLGIVVHSLEANHVHIPFRDSKLTRLLQDSLGGNGKTRIVITISPSVMNSQETIGSLMFGERAMNVKTAAKVNEAVDYRALYVKLKAQLDSLEEKYSELEEDYLDVTNENEKMDIEIDSLIEENKKLIKEKRVLEKEKEKEKEKIVSLMKGDLLDLETQHERQIKDLNERILSLYKEYESEFNLKEEHLKKIIVQKDSEIDRLELLVQELAREKSFLETQLSSKEKEFDNLLTTTYQMEKDLETTSYLCIRRENELERVQELIQDLENQISSQRETILKNVDEIENMEKKILSSTELLENTTQLLQDRKTELEHKQLLNCKLKEEIDFLTRQIIGLEERIEFEMEDKETQRTMLLDKMDRELRKERELASILKEEKNEECGRLQNDVEKMKIIVGEKNGIIHDREKELEKLKLLLVEEQRERENDKLEQLKEKEQEQKEKESILLELQYYKDKIEEFTSKVFSTPNNTTILNIVEESSDPSSILQAPPIPSVEKVPIFDFGKIVCVQNNIIKRYEGQFLSSKIKSIISNQQREKLLSVINKLTIEKNGLSVELQSIRQQLEELHAEISNLFSSSRFIQDDLLSNVELFGCHLHQLLFEKNSHSRSFEIINGELKDLKFISKKTRDESADEAACDAINYIIWALEYSHPYSSLPDNLLGEENSKEIIKSLLEESEKRVKSSSKASAEHTLEIDSIWKHVKKTLDYFYDSSTDEYKTVLNELDCDEYQKLFTSYIRKKNGPIVLEDMTDPPISISELLENSRVLISKTRINCYENEEFYRLLCYWLSISGKCLKKVLNREEINHKAGVYLMHEFIHLLHTVRNVLYLFDCSERDVLIYKLALHGCASKLSKFINSSEEVRREMEDRIASYEDLRTRTEAALVIQRFYRKTKRKMQEDFIKKQRTDLIAQSQAQMVKIRELQKSELTFKASVGKQIADTGRVLIKQGVSEIDHIFNILKAYFLYGDDDDVQTPSSPRSSNVTSPNSSTTPDRHRSGSLSPSPPNPLRENFGGRPKSAVSRAYSKRFSEIDVAEINDILSNTKVSPTARKVLEKSLPPNLTKKACVLNREGNCGLSSNVVGELLISHDPKQLNNIGTSLIGEKVACSTPSEYVSNPLCKEKWFRKIQHDKQIASIRAPETVLCSIDVNSGDCQVGTFHYSPEQQFKYHHHGSKQMQVCNSLQAYYSNPLCKEKWFRKFTLSISQTPSLKANETTIVPNSQPVSTNSDSLEANNRIITNSTENFNDSNERIIQQPKLNLETFEDEINEAEIEELGEEEIDLIEEEIEEEVEEIEENNVEDNEEQHSEIEETDVSPEDDGDEQYEENEENEENDVINQEKLKEERVKTAIEQNILKESIKKYREEITKALKEIKPIFRKKPLIRTPYIQSATNVSGSIGKVNIKTIINTQESNKKTKRFNNNQSKFINRKKKSTEEKLLASCKRD